MYHNTFFLFLQEKNQQYNLYLMRDPLIHLSFPDLRFGILISSDLSLICVFRFSFRCFFLFPVESLVSINKKRNLSGFLTQPTKNIYRTDSAETPNLARPPYEHPVERNHFTHTHPSSPSKIYLTKRARVGK